MTICRFLELWSMSQSFTDFPVGWKDQVFRVDLLYHLLKYIFTPSCFCTKPCTAWVLPNSETRRNMFPGWKEKVPQHQKSNFPSLCLYSPSSLSEIPTRPWWTFCQKNTAPVSDRHTKAFPETWTSWILVTLNMFYSSLFESRDRNLISFMLACHKIKKEN